MSHEPVARLSSADGRRSVDAELATLLRTHAWAEAEALMGQALESVPGPVAAACLATPDRVEVEGWDKLDAGLVRRTRRGDEITAVGLDLSNYHDARGDDWWDKEPAVEVVGYLDSAFPFSTATTAELLAASVSYSAPWTGRMSGDIGMPLFITGLQRLNGAVLRHHDDDTPGADPREDAAAHLGAWWQKLRFRQAVARHLESRGMALLVPVLVGSHDVGPWLVTVQDVPHVSDHEETTERLLAEEDKENRRAYQRVSDDTARELWELRENSRKSWGLLNGGKRRTYVELADARLAMVCQVAGLPKPSTSIARMPEAEFRSIVIGWMDHRRAGLDS
jgi:hypothetical protein